MSLTIRHQLVFVTILLSMANASWAELTIEGYHGTRCPEVLSSVSSDYGRLRHGLQTDLDSIYPLHENQLRDCWYFAHSEHGGGAFVPYEWGIEGEPEASIAEALVEAALTALPRILDTYAEANGRLTNPVFLAFLNEGYNSRAAAYDIYFAPEDRANMGTPVTDGPLGDRACLIVIRHPDNWRSAFNAGADPVDTLEFGLAHEVAHCYFAKKLYRRIPVRSWEANSFHKWWEEGAAHYMAGHVFPNREILTDQARRYEFDKDVIDNAYGNFWLIGAFDYEREYWWDNSLTQIEATSSPRFRNLWRFLERAATSFDKPSAYRVIDEFFRQKVRLYRTLAMYRNGATSMGRVCSGDGEPRRSWCTLSPSSIPEPDFSLPVGSAGRHELSLGDINPGFSYVVEVALANEASIAFPHSYSFEEMVHIPTGHRGGYGVSLELFGRSSAASSGTAPSHAPPSNPLSATWYWVPSTTFGFCNPNYSGVRARYTVFTLDLRRYRNVSLRLYANTREVSEQAFEDASSYTCDGRSCPLPPLERLCGSRFFYEYAGER